MKQKPCGAQTGALRCTFNPAVSWAAVVLFFWCFGHSWRRLVLLVVC